MQIAILINNFLPLSLEVFYQFVNNLRSPNK